MLNIKLEKATPGRSPRKRKTLLQQLQGRVYRLPAHLTNDDDWQRDVPNVKLSRAFAVVLGIHVVAIGGFMAFELFRHKDDSTSAGTPARSPVTGTTTNEPLPMTARAPVSSSIRGAEPALNDPANEGLRTYVVGPGETLGAIASKFDVDEHLLAQKNGIGRDRPFETGMKLVIPNQQITARRPDDLERLLEKTEKAPRTSNESLPVVRAEPVEKPASARSAERSTAASEPSSTTAAGPADDKPIRRAEPLTESTRIKPNKDPKRTSAPPAKVSASQASRLATATAGSPVKRASGTGGDRPAPSKPAARGRRTHVVAEGDTAYRIARTYKVDVDDLIKANSVKPEKLRPGMKLVIPASSN